MDGEMPNKDRPYLIVAVGQNFIQTIGCFDRQEQRMESRKLS